MALQRATAVSSVCGLVCSPLMISTPFWTGTGFMKWVETTRELAEVSFGSLVVAAAMRVMEMDDVFVASIACLGQTSASLEKISNFSSGISGTASMTKSTSDRDSSVVEGDRSERALSASSWLIRDLATSLARSFSIGRGSASWQSLFDGDWRTLDEPAKVRPLSSDFWNESTNVTGIWAFCAATRAIPRPLIWG